MVRSISSSSTEYASAKESPERNGSSGSSAVEYHSANEDPIAVLEQMKVSPYLAIEFTRLQNPRVSSLIAMSLAVDFCHTKFWMLSASI